ncbi:fatty acid--CoA ligase family protein [Paenibacillus sp. sptzw28]|uniref:ANL family adenylate-forming protein n=1 Tax=Paenibacillus sp. sptzw28 TaxID=715179 RepID=UPI001C6F27DB|nr:fatty acid--CoA ligase family protein [Paenibacillus sp. sptzw28]QYR20251.1 fatty acid--CoA ligase family protein [Paenibacillus sp. sptzw28]
MEKIFLATNVAEYSYSRLIEDLNAKGDYSVYVYVKYNHPYKIFLSIIHSLIYKYSIEILDGDFSAQELQALGIDPNRLEITRPVEKRLHIDSLDTLLDRVKDQDTWTLTLYTSGTTGRPKKVSHHLKTLIRNVRCSGKYSNNVWAFAYNPTHMAGLQVFFQALWNHNTIIYAFGGEQRNLPSLLQEYEITHISATSTFYRNAIPFMKGREFPQVRRITFGGEKYDSGLEQQIKSIFTNAEIRNVYASTETGSLFVSKGNLFQIPDSIREQIRISERNELFIHCSLLGQSDSFSLEGEWFNTGDLVEQIDECLFKFTSRKSELINVGGYKVNPVEVENILLKVPGVIDLLVKGRENRVTGQILVADVVKSANADDQDLKRSIKHYAASCLQEWKVPRLINFVDSLPRTRTGKKVRK